MVTLESVSRLVLPPAETAMATWSNAPPRLPSRACSSSTPARPRAGAPSPDRRRARRDRARAMAPAPPTSSWPRRSRKASGSWSRASSSPTASRAAGRSRPPTCCFGGAESSCVAGRRKVAQARRRTCPRKWRTDRVGWGGVSGRTSESSEALAASLAFGRDAQAADSKFQGR
jgi:hypothetical protein